MRRDGDLTVCRDTHGCNLRAKETLPCDACGRPRPAPALTQVGPFLVCDDQSTCDGAAADRIRARNPVKSEHANDAAVYITPTARAEIDRVGRELDSRLKHGEPPYCADCGAHWPKGGPKCLACGVPAIVTTKRADAEPGPNPIEPRRPQAPEEVVMVTIATMWGQFGAFVELKHDGLGRIVLNVHDADDDRAHVSLNEGQLRNFIAEVFQVLARGPLGKETR